MSCRKFVIAIGTLVLFRTITFHESLQLVFEDYKII